MAGDVLWSFLFKRDGCFGMATEEGFMDCVEELRNLGAKHVFLKTGVCIEKCSYDALSGLGRPAV